MSKRSEAEPNAQTFLESISERLDVADDVRKRLRIGNSTASGEI
jgi:hypothetical protein